MPFFTPFKLLGRSLEFLVIAAKKNPEHFPQIFSTLPFMAFESKKSWLRKTSQSWKLQVNPRLISLMAFEGKTSFELSKT